MSVDRTITMSRGWGVMLKDLGIEPQDVVRRAGMSLDLLQRESLRVDVDDYFTLLAAMEEVADDPLLAIRLARVASPETFSPPMFAALCSSTLVVAVERIGVHKRLVAPMQVTSELTDQELRIEWQWDDPTIRSPPLMMAMELVFMTQIARIGTRERLQPLRLGCPAQLEPREAYEEFFGVAPSVTERVSIVFSHADANRPFLTASETMWQTFEPALRRRLSKLDAQAPLSQRIASVLLECLPSGEASIDGTARRLGMSRRTLQRRLKDEGFVFREILKDTRERLSRHYLSNTTLPYAEIAFLLGFDEPSSFFRAFREWTGTTPESVRLAKARSSGASPA